MSSGSLVIISRLRGIPGRAVLRVRTIRGEVEHARPERDLGEPEPSVVLLDGHVLEVGRDGPRGEGLDDFHRVFEQGHAVARVEADPDVVGTHRAEQSEQLVGP